MNNSIWTTMTTTGRRATAATAAALLVTGGVAACSAPEESASAEEESSTSSSTDASTDASSSGSEASTAESPDLETLISEVQGTFEQETYEDSETGESLSYSIHLPEDYDSSKDYPLVLYIPDSSLVGQDAETTLSEYGALIWADDSQESVDESIVIVPEFPEVTIDDHGEHTTTDYVEMTARLVEQVQEDYSVDPDRVYGTGQSMGCMTIMYLAAQHPDLFTAELFVSGQWDPSDLEGLAEENFLYFAAAGDENASGGQEDVQALLDEAGVSYGTTTLDATADASEQEAAVSEMLAAGETANFATFEEGTVLEASGEGADSSAPGGEHMASFQPAYEIAAAQEWLFAQTVE